MIFTIVFTEILPSIFVPRKVEDLQFQLEEEALKDESDVSSLYIVSLIFLYPKY